MKWHYILVLPLLLVCSSLAFSADSLGSTANSNGEFLPVDEAFALSVERAPDGATELTWRIAPGYYLYQQQLTFSGLDEDLHPPLPAGISYYDEFFGDMQVYRDSLQLTISPQHAGTLTLGWQGCADAGLCYPPQYRDIGLDTAASQTGSQGSLNAGSPQTLAEDQRVASQLENWSLPLALVLFFGLGLLLAFTPCSLPMLPILAGLVVGSGATARRGVMLASVYVFSMALVYAALGMLAALIGGNLQAVLQQPWVLGGFAGIFVLLALPMFGVFELQLPAFVRARLDQAGRKQVGGHLGGAAMLGVLSGLLVGPCMTAPLAGALLYIGQTGDMLQGGLALFALGIGMGVPLLLLVTVGQRFLPRPGAWMNRVKVVFGFVFLATALFIIRPVLDSPEQGHMDAFTTLDTPAELDRQLADARAAGEWVLVDYYADWCVSCKIMEQQVFGRADVMASLNGVRLLRPDVTTSSAESRELLSRYAIHGPPTLLWFGPDGQERRAHRITGEVNANEFLQRWQAAKGEG